MVFTTPIEGFYQNKMLERMEATTTTIVGKSEFDGLSAELHGFEESEQK